MIAPISAVLPSGNGLVAGLSKTSANVALIVPSIVQDLTHDPALLDYCAQHLDAVFYCGGDLPQAIGDIVAAKIKLFNQFGATELGLTPIILSLKNRSNADWKYVQFHPKLGLELRHIADDVSELYAVRNPKLKEYQYTFTLFPDQQEYASRDLFVRHPHKPDLWKWKARADDIIVFLNGEKTNPISMEQHITARNPGVAAVLVVGAQRFQAALLVEPSTPHESLSAFQRAGLIERIWPSIEEANLEAPSHARILKSHVLFTSPSKPMLRAGKGTVQRSGTLKAYESEIEALYRDAEQMSSYPSTPTVAEPFSFDEDKMSQCISHSIMAVTGWSHLSASEDFFTRGMDSLHIILLTRKLKQQVQLRDFSPSTIYTNPSVLALTKTILNMHNQSQAMSSTTQQARLKNRNDLLEEYKRKMDRLRSSKTAEKQTTNLETVVLTGSTGALGSYLLDRLLANPAVGHVHCLNRLPDSLAIQMRRNKARGLERDLESKTTFHWCDLSRSMLGLPVEQYSEFIASATLIIHNAWLVNFNLDLSTFRPQLDGIVNLIDFASNSSRKAQLLFVSSVSSVMAYRAPNARIPERVISADASPAPNGYAESKHLSELLLDYADQKLDTRSSIARVGQLAGPADSIGSWNATEWFPSLVISSCHIGALPASLGPTFDSVDWLPIDLLAGILVELAVGRSNKARNNVYHLVNPHKLQWNTVRTTVADAISQVSGKTVGIVPTDRWLADVRKAMETEVSGLEIAAEAELDGALRRNPAAKLLGFYEQMFGAADDGPVCELELEETLACSGRLRGMQELQGSWIQRWVTQWLDTLERDGDAEMKR